MIQDFGDEGESTLANDQRYGIKVADPYNLSPGGKQMSRSKYDDLDQQSQVLLVEPVDYGRDYYMLLRKVHQERTSCAHPSKEELLSSFKILKESMNNSQQARQKVGSQLESGSRMYGNPYELPSKSIQISKVTQVRLAGSAFNEKTDLSSNKALATKHDLVAGKDLDCVRYTIKIHHDEVNKDNEIFTKEEHYVLRRQKELKQKKIQDSIKKRQIEVQKKYSKNELYT